MINLLLNSSKLPQIEKKKLQSKRYKMMLMKFLLLLSQEKFLNKDKSQFLKSKKLRNKVSSKNSMQWINKNANSSLSVKNNNAPTFILPKNASFSLIANMPLTVYISMKSADLGKTAEDSVVPMNTNKRSKESNL